jgi:heat shock protein beta
LTEITDVDGALVVDAGDLESLVEGIEESIAEGIDSTALDNLAASVSETQDIDQDDDGIPNSTDPDDDNDGTPDVDDDDDDNDGTKDAEDLDDDNDGILDTAEGAVDDFLGAFGDLMDQVTSGDACLGDYVAAVGEVGDADYAEAYCITDDDDCEFCAKDGVCVAEADMAVCDTGSSAGLVVGLILGILAAVAIGIVVYCFCCKGDDDGYQKQH